MSTELQTGSVYDWFTEYCKNQKGLSQNTISSYRCDLSTFKAFLQERGLGIPDVTLRVIDQYINEQAAGRKNKSSTVRRKIETLRAFFRYLYRIDEVDSDLMKKVDSPKVPRRLPHYLSPEQQEQLLNYFDAKSFTRPKHRFVAQRDKVTTLVFMETGIRVGELCALKIRDVDFNRRILKVRGKGDKEREVFLPSRSAEALDEYLRNIRPELVKRGYVRLPQGRKKYQVLRYLSEKQSQRYHQGSFVSREDAEKALHENLEEDLGFLFVCSVKKGLDTRSVFMTYARAGASLGFRIHPHLLRHTFASNLRSRGADLLLIKEALGHEQISTTQIYAHISNERYKAEISKYLDNVIEQPKVLKVVQGPWKEGGRSHA